MAIVGFIIRRILYAAIVFTMVGFVSFGIVCLMPGDFYTPMDMWVAVFDLDPEIPELLRADAGIDKPFIVQFFIWFKGVVFHGDFGLSLETKGPASAFILKRGGPAWMTLIVSGPPMIVAWLVGIPLGVILAMVRGRAGRLILDIISYPFLSIPAYVFGFLLQWFIFKFIDPLFIGPGLWGFCGWRYENLPMSLEKFGSCILHLIPIMFLIGAPIAIMVTRIMRNSMIDALSQRHVLVARSKGAGEFRVLVRHATRNALNPLISLFGAMLPTLMMNTIIVARLFNIPTFGRILLDVLKTQDQHVVTAALLFYGTILVIGSLLSDLGLLWCDPRIRHT